METQVHILHMSRDVSLIGAIFFTAIFRADILDEGKHVRVEFELPGTSPRSNSFVKLY